MTLIRNGIHPPEQGYPEQHGWYGRYSPPSQQDQQHQQHQQHGHGWYGQQHPAGPPQQYHSSQGPVQYGGPGQPEPHAGQQGWHGQQPAPGHTYPGYPVAGYGYGQQGYYGPAPAGYMGPTGYGYATPAPTEQSAGWALGLAIASYPLAFACGAGVITAIVSLVLAHQAKGKILASGGALEGAGLARWGAILSWIFLGLFVLVVVGAVVNILNIVNATGPFQVTSA